MKNAKKRNDLMRQNETIVKPISKKDVNLKNNSIVYFLVGLILSLLAVNTALEHQFFSFEKQYAVVVDNEPEDVVYTMDTFIIESDPVVKQEVAKVVAQKVILKDVFKVVENKVKTIEQGLITTESPTVTTPAVKVKDVPDIKKPDEGPFNIMAVHKVPVFPGCEGATTNDERRLCMSEKMSRFIGKKFDLDIASENDLHGQQRIYVKFKINKQGKVEVLNTRAPHPSLENEAKRVVEKFPDMMPALVNNRSVDVLFTIPILFNIQ